MTIDYDTPVAEKYDSLLCHTEYTLRKLNNELEKLIDEHMATQIKLQKLLAIVQNELEEY